MTQNTPNLGLPYPELSDTADVPRDIEALAVTLDALLGGGTGGGGGGVLPLAAVPVLDVGIVNQIRAGRQLSAADFTSLGLSPPLGLWSLSDLTNQGSDGRPLVNLGAVPFGVGINGLAATAAVFAGSTGQALYVADSGAADPYRIRTGSWGCWFRTAKQATEQALLSRSTNTGNQRGWILEIASGGMASALYSFDGTGFTFAVGVSNVTDDRWHFAVATADGGTLRLYVDGVLEAVAAVNGPLFAAAAPVNVGAASANASTAAVLAHYGRVDEAFVCPDVLTDDQIRLLYAAKLAHTLGAIPTAARLKVHRRRKGSAFAVADFTTQPIRLHNFTAGALTDQGSGAVALTNNGAAVAVAGADGTPGDAYNFNATANQSLSATDAGLPGGLTVRSYGCWFKTTGVAVAIFMAWGTAGTGDARLINNAGFIASGSGGDSTPNGPYIADGRWHLVVAVEDNAAGDGVKRKLYCDGQLVGGSTVMNAITLAGANQFRVGAHATGGFPFTGQIDGAFVCGYALGPAEILNLYAKGAQDLGGSPKNAGDHVERVDAASVLFIADTLESQHTVDLGVVA
jgi:Concanavalin A-like lectin/glucanases superfamily